MVRVKNKPDNALESICKVENRICVLTVEYIIIIETWRKYRDEYNNVNIH